jgi:hypothetical protein
MPSLAIAWNYHHWQLHGTTINGSFMELPSLAAAVEYTARNAMTGLIWEFSSVAGILSMTTA